jgi:hypothetical protein
LVDAGSEALVIPVTFDRPQPGAHIYYRVCASSLVYHNAYKLERGPAQFSAVRSFRLPDPSASSLRVAVVNDTHENGETLGRLSTRIETAAPDLLVWDGDTCNDFDAQDDPAAILLTPGAAADDPAAGGWASTRPLLVPLGNHDVRGARARELERILAVGSEPGLPWNFAFRDGPLALIGLDTGEDKPDAHPVFAGTAAYEPYRKRQAVWLKDVLERPGISSAPFKAVFCHIPLQGRPGDNPGTTLKGYAGYSGFGAALWMPLMQEAGVSLVVSGHTHSWRIDDPVDKQPVMQVVGGGPQPERATLTMLEVTENALAVQVQDLDGKTLAARTLKA